MPISPLMSSGWEALHDVGGFFTGFRPRYSMSTRTQLITEFTTPPKITAADARDFVNSAVLPEDLVAGDGVTLDKSSLPAVTITADLTGKTITPAAISIPDLITPTITASSAGDLAAATVTGRLRGKSYYGSPPAFHTDVLLDRFGNVVIDYNGSFDPNWGAGISFDGAHNSYIWGAVTIGSGANGSSLNAKQTLHFRVLPGIYANNAAAITGGLVAGDVYRTGSDPDQICIVH